MEVNIEVSEKTSTLFQKAFRESGATGVGLSETLTALLSETLTALLASALSDGFVAGAKSVLDEMSDVAKAMQERRAATDATKDAATDATKDAATDPSDPQGAGRDGGMIS